MRILLISQDYPPVPGGVQTYARQLACGLAACGHQIQIVAPVSAAQFEKDLPVEGIRVSNPIWMGVKLLWHIRAIVRRFEPDVILHMQWTSALWLALPAFWRPKVPVICLVHGRELIRYRLRLLMKRVLNAASVLVANSHAVRALTANISEKAENSIAIIFPGVDTRVFRPIPQELCRRRFGLPEGVPIVVNLTRHVARKNTRGLLETFARVRLKVPLARLVIGGTGPELPALRVLSERLGITDAVSWLGRVAQEDLPYLYGVATCFCLPSLHSDRDVEGFGMVFMEAAACGVPSIATRSGGITDAVIDGETGLLVSEGNAEELICALEQLCLDQDLRDKLGSRALQRAVQFSWEHVAAQYEEIARGIG